MVLGATPDSVSALTEAGSTLGRLLGVAEVVLVGVYSGAQGPTMQFDRIGVSEGVRDCSVRLNKTNMGDELTVEGRLGWAWS